MKTKDKLLNTAVEMFAEYGYQGVRIEALVKKAKVNKATFYYYFKGKREIFKIVMENRLSDFYNVLTKSLAGCSTPHETMEALVDVMFSRNMLDVQLFTREIIEGGSNIPDELYSLMSDIVDIQSSVLSHSQKDNASFLLFLLVGVSDFYLTMGAFQERWTKYTQRHSSVQMIYFDRETLKKKMCSLIAREFDIKE